MSSAINHSKRSHRSYARHVSAARSMAYHAPTSALKMGKRPTMFSNLLALTRARPHGMRGNAEGGKA